MNIKAITKHRWIDLLKRSFDSWMADKALRLSAALAYYSIFSIAPLLVITIGIAGLFVGREAASGQLYAELRGYVGAQSAEALQSMVQSASKPAQGLMATVIGFAILILGASGVFGQLKDALNTVWDVKPKPGIGVMAFLRDKLLNFGMVLVIGFLLLVSLLLSTAIAGLNQRLENVLELPALVWAATAFVISLSVVSTLFATIFKVLPDVKVAWHDVWVGAVITGLLFEIGKTGLSWYLGRESTASAYGAAGAVVLLLLWVYYTSCILLLGAEFTQVYAQSGGRVIEPAANALRISTGDRAQQGLDPGAQPLGELDRPVDRTVHSSTPNRLMVPFLEYLEGLGTLLSVEASEALRHVIRLSVWVVVAIVAIFVGWLLVVTALVGWLAPYLDGSWVMAAGITGGLHILAGLTAGLLIRRHLTKALWIPDTRVADERVP